MGKGKCNVFCIGNANVDVYADRGEKYFGGSAANTAVRLKDLQRTGMTPRNSRFFVNLVAVVGTDPTSAAIIRQLTQRGVRTKFLARYTGASQQSSIALDETCERRIDRGERRTTELVLKLHKIAQHGDLRILPRGYNSVDLEAAQIDRSLWVHVKAPTLVLSKLASLGVKCGSLDLGSIENAVDWSALVPILSVAIVTGNEQEVARVGGLDALWVNPTVSLICLKQGDRGATLFPRDRFAVQINAFPVDLVDTTGAGDAFNAGIIWGILHGWSLPDVGQLACALGALTCTVQGAQNPPITLQGLQNIGYEAPSRK